MSPESMIALLSASAVGLVLCGGYLLGHAKGRPAEPSRLTQLKGELDELRSKYLQAENALAAAKALDGVQAGIEQERALRSAAEQKSEKLKSELLDLKASLAKLEGAADRISALEKERDTVVQRSERLERERNEVRSELAKAAEAKTELTKSLEAKSTELKNLEAKKQESHKSADTVKLITERDEARDWLAAAERIMEGVRARSAGLQAELKQLKAEMDGLKKR